MPRRWLTSIALCSALAGSAAGAGCATPTLPLPPPTALATTPDNDGFVTVAGEALAGAHVTVFNARTGRSVGETVDDLGRYSIAIAAEVGDLLTVEQRVGSEHSPGVDVLVPSG